MRSCKLCGTDIAHLRADARFCNEGCSKRWRRGERPDRPRTGKRPPTRYRVFAIDLATGKLTPAGEVSANKREQAVAQVANGSAPYIAIPVSSLRLHDAEGRKLPAS